MAKVNTNTLRNKISDINRIDFTKGNIGRKETTMNDIINVIIIPTIQSNTNFLEYSDTNIQLLEELKTTLESISHTGGGVDASVDNALTAVNNLINHIETVRNHTESIVVPTTPPNIHIGTLTNIDLTRYFESAIITNLRLQEPGGIDKNIQIRTTRGRTINRTRTVGTGDNLNINTTTNNLEVNIGPGDLPTGLGLVAEDYPLTVELDFLVENAGGGTNQIKTMPRVKFTLTEPTNRPAILAEMFTATENYQTALNTRISNFYTNNAETIVREYLLERINASGGGLSDVQKNILVDHLYNDAAHLNGDANNAYSMVDLQTFFPEQIENDSIGGEDGYRNNLRNLLINTGQFNTRTREILLERLRNQRNVLGWRIEDAIINQQVNNFIQEQATNSIGNITNGVLPGVLGAFGNKNNDTIRQQNKHKTGFRGWKKLIGVFQGKKRRKLTDISTNNYFSFFSGSTYNINDTINVAGRNINQNITINFNSWNNISASIDVTGDEQANFEFAGANSVYELITGILGNNQVGAVTKIYMIFNIYKQLFKKMQSLFGNQDIRIGVNTYNVQSQNDLIIRQNGNNIFNENQFRSLENANELQTQMTNLGTYFNTIMNEWNQRYIRGMTTRKHNKFKIGKERVGKILRKRKNNDFNFAITVEGVNIRYEESLFVVTYQGEEIKANNLETILSNKILEGKQIQIMKAVYKELINKTANDPKAQTVLNRRSGIGFLVEHNGVNYIVSTQGGTLRFGIIPTGFPPANINRKSGIITGGMYTTINENEILSNSELAATIIRKLRTYRRKGIKVRKT